MLKFYGQPKFRSDGATQQPIGYELFIREYQNNQWCLPQDFCAITAGQIQHLLSDTVQAMPDNIELLSFNLEQIQFIDPVFTDAVASVQDTTDIQLFTELTERTDPRVTLNQLSRAAKRFHDEGLLVCIDDVGTGDNTPELVLALDDYIDEYKFALQNFRPFNHISDIESHVSYWYNMAQKYDKMLAIEGLENEEDLEVIRTKYPCDVIQGYYTGMPALIEC
ncbi:hypothetical protein AYR62_14890 [Secundilactobacillus paracollinoides]|uniref:EAL domain-containing protein n=1 Tax=Secundilactobacillus paracollinoides TaxID=240427 RepID=A0A1B2IXG9_9LACO|nr:EAL domain-containing protein [Secundilactobacillus paracollinoides]ANZ60850.1 hypothetical protein AYR61_05510 [Secundilactobacillus paracollinoides]ANZ65237.1 hypothetical protein AYR62_14890 [Secundilactobacillus paracollinoides]ANZ66708.1 hypothetical protein AYR63_05880 [Secundilactobacillus paracollinoides]KRL80800.1 C-di-GMP-specific phosphodiesterase [Secundilactobacillus paracollinoides DSM 15502 = JCM 11969]